MKVIIEGIEYRVRWQYDLPTRTGYNQTSCYIQSDGEIQVQSVKKWHKDEHNKEYARKASLKKVLLTMYPTDKNKRKVFWDAYVHRKDSVFTQ